MSTGNETFLLLAEKLGIHGDDKILKKAAEFERLLQTKSTAGNNMSDTGKIVICLDLAASYLRFDFDLKNAIKYSGLKPIAYTNCKKTLENLLELNEQLTISMLCISLQCSNMEVLAENILQQYQKQAKMDMDLKMPQYVCMAVYQACRISKVKVSKSKIIEKSRLKAAQWSKLDADWSKFVDENFTKSKKKKEKQNKKTLEDDVAMEIDDNQKNTEESSEPQVESYVSWKKRMLEAAYKKLKQTELENNTKSDIKELESDMYSRNNLSPRRSPRKTPQKFSPYKNSPVKGKGVRLLFPMK